MMIVLISDKIFMDRVNEDIESASDNEEDSDE